MPDIIQWLRLKADASGLKKGAKEAGESLTASFVKAQIATKALSAATELLTNMVKDGAKAALEYEKTTTRLATALKIQGRESSVVMEGLQAAAGRYEELSGISDEIIRTYQAQAIALGKTSTETNQLIEASLSLSQVTGRDLRTSFESILKTEQGLIDRTIKLVPEIASLTKEELAAGKAVDVLNEKYGEFIDIGTRGGYGALVRLKNEFANVGEEVAKLGNEKDGFIVQLNRALGDLFEWQRRILADSSLSQWERLAFMFAPFFDADAASQYQANLKRQEEYARRMIEIQEKIDKREGRGPKKKPAAISGRGKKGKTFGMEDMQAMLAGTEELVRESTERQYEIQAEADERLHAKKQADLEAMAEWRINHEEKLSQWLIDKRLYHAELEGKIEQERLAEQERMENTRMALAQRGVGIMVGMLEKLAMGSRISAKEMTIAMLQGLGKQLMAEGAAAILRGTLAVYTGNPAGWGMIKTGGGMIALGTGMIAGGTSMAGGGGGATGGSIAPGVRGFRGTATGGGGTLATRAAPSREPEREPQNVTIIMHGPQTPEGVGVAVHDAIAKARAKGLIQ